MTDTEVSLLFYHFKFKGKKCSYRIYIVMTCGMSGWVQAATNCLLYLLPCSPNIELPILTQSKY